MLNYHPRALVGDGGITNSVQRLSESLVGSSGADVGVAVDEGDPRGQPAKFDWVKLDHIGPRALRVPSGLGRKLDGVDILVLNSAWTAHNVVAGRIAKRNGVPYMLSPRGAYDPQLLRRRQPVKRAWWRTMEARLVRDARALSVFFEEQEKDVRTLGYEGDIVVSPNGVRVPPGWHWDGGSGGYILYIGRFDPEHKGLDLLIDAIALLPPAERPDVRLYGPDWRGGKARTVAQIEARGLERWVEIHPPVYGDEKWKTFQRSLGFVYPSRWEGFGNSLAEAAALGLPTLATPYPLARFLEQRGATVVTGAVPEELANGLKVLVDSDAAARGSSGAKVVATEFDWDNVADSWYRQVSALL